MPEETGEANNDTSINLEPEEELDTRESIIAKAALHVNQAGDQRRLCNSKIKEAEDDLAANLSFGDSPQVIICDFGQNISCPQLAKSQAGDTFYWSALNVFIFGIVDTAIRGGALDAYVYHEGHGKKGGNNVASLLMMFLGKKGWLRKKDPGKELTIIMDNCGGQNKNNHVLRLALILTEIGYFKKVTFIFYIVGHTKNACDRWFNTLKKHYRTQNIWTFRTLCRALASSNDTISINTVETGDFKDYHGFEERFYHLIESGKIQPGHIFTVDSLKPGIMVIKEDDLGTFPPHTQTMTKNGAGSTEHGDRAKTLAK